MFKVKATCPQCQKRFSIENIFKDNKFYFCPNCDIQLNYSKPIILYAYQFGLFITNNVLWLSIIFFAYYLFKYQDDYKSFSAFLFMTSTVLFSLAYHEFLHAFFAFITGDKAVIERGYLKLNILRYYNSINSMIIPVTFFIFTGIFLPGAAVFVSVRRNQHLRNIIVSVAGPLANFIFYIIILKYLEIYGSNENIEIVTILHCLAYIQIFIFLFNMLPVPGLDGWSLVSWIFSDFLNGLLAKLAPLIIMGTMYSMISPNSEFVYEIFKSIKQYSNLNPEYINKGFRYLRLTDPNPEQFIKNLQPLIDVVKNMLLKL